ncbi:ATP-binding protein [Isoptericola sediminis]|uniref:ATP-binding protein n=1 Tax=Isoptericola sediminis TaxID=2733572 RepID=UPI0031B5CA1B
MLGACEVSPASAGEARQDVASGCVRSKVTQVGLPPGHAPGRLQPSRGLFLLVECQSRSLDEAPEFSPRVLQTLRQPLESGELVLHRSGGAARYPARFQLVLAANPCPCGMSDTRAGQDCTCTVTARRRYLARLSGPLLDRVDLRVHVTGPSRADRLLGGAGESTRVVADRVAVARGRARERLRGTPWRTNAELPGPWLHDRLGKERAVLGPVERLVDDGGLSLRGAHRVLRVAWTVADLDGRDLPGRADVDTALALRSAGPRG